jgi:hypothetical protein
MLECGVLDGVLDGVVHDSLTAFKSSSPNHAIVQSPRTIILDSSHTTLCTARCLL